jgi:hypothetical protein
MQEQILDCGHVPSEHGPHTTGYGTDADGKRHCFECCAKKDRERMRNMAPGEKITLYLTRDKDKTVKTPAGVTLGSQWHVSNWPGTLKVPCGLPKAGRHNIAGTRRDVWFCAEGAQWWGVQYGEWTEVVHCTKLKAHE